jgi:hypothetical protein
MRFLSGSIGHKFTRHSIHIQDTLQSIQRMTVTDNNSSADYEEHKGNDAADLADVLANADIEEDAEGAVMETRLNTNTREQSRNLTTRC